MFRSETSNEAIRVCFKQYRNILDIIHRIQLFYFIGGVCQNLCNHEKGMGKTTTFTTTNLLLVVFVTTSFNLV